MAMLCPEVWTFKPPRCNISFNRVSKEKFPALLDDLVLSHYFNHSVSIVLPDTESVPAAVSSELTNNADYYKVKHLPVSEFIDKQFVDTFVRAGGVTALSIGTLIDTDDCVAITPSGHLLLTVSRETYQTLGIEGKPSYVCGKRPERYLVNINLKVPWTKGQQLRLWKAFTEHVRLEMDFIIAWDPPSDEICPSTIAKYFKDKNYTVNLCSPRVTLRDDDNIMVPSLTNTDHEELLEWLGVYTLGLNTSLMTPVMPPKEGTNIPSKKEAERASMNVAFLQCDGLFTTAQIHRLIDRLRKHAEKPSRAPWVSIHVQGFTDAPVTWHFQEHKVYMHGANQYTLFISTDDGSVVSCKMYTSQKKRKNKKT